MHVKNHKYRVKSEHTRTVRFRSEAECIASTCGMRIAWKNWTVEKKSICHLSFHLESWGSQHTYSLNLNYKANKNLNQDSVDCRKGAK